MRLQSRRIAKLSLRHRLGRNNCLSLSRRLYDTGLAKLLGRHMRQRRIELRRIVLEPTPNLRSNRLERPIGQLDPIAHTIQVIDLPEISIHTINQHARPRTRDPILLHQSRRQIFLRMLLLRQTFLILS